MRFFVATCLAIIAFNMKNADSFMGFSYVSKSYACKARKASLHMGILSRGRKIRIITPSGEETVTINKRSSRQDIKNLSKNYVQADATLGAYYAEDEEQEDRSSTQKSTQQIFESRENLPSKPPNKIQETKSLAEFSPLRISAPFGRVTFFILGFFVLQFLIVLARKGFDIRKATATELDWEYLVTEKEHIKELHAYRCEKCGYTLFPARSRHKKFFEDVKDFSCPECGAPKTEFVDIHDLTDPRNIHRSREELEEAMKAKIKAETEALVRDAGVQIGNSNVSKGSSQKQEKIQSKEKTESKIEPSSNISINPELPSTDSKDDLLD